MNVRSLVSLERRLKFANAVTIAGYNVVCLCETWLNDRINSSELFLDGYNIYRADRPTSESENAHGGSLIAVKSTLISKAVECSLPDSCSACMIQLNSTQVFFDFYSPPKNSA